MAKLNNLIVNENGIEKKAIIYGDDFSPAKLIHNGNVLTNVSFNDKLIEGTTSVTYESDYKKNLLELNVEGNTYQKQLQGKNLLDAEKMVELMKKYWANTDIREVDGRRCVYFNNAYFNTKDFTSCCPVFKENTRYIFSCYARPNEILSADATYAGSLVMGFKGVNFNNQITGVKDLSAKTTIEFTRMYAVNNTNTTVTDILISFGSAYNWLIDLDTVYLYEYEGDDNPPYEEYTGRIPSPNPTYPQDIINASGLSVELTTNGTTTTVSIPSEVTLASQDKLLVNYIDKSVKVNRAYVKLNLADLNWNYGISSQTNVTFFYLTLPYIFTGTGYFNRGKVNTLTNAELNELTNTIVIRTRRVGTSNELEIAFSPDFDLKADGTNYGDVDKLMAWLEANPCEVLLKISSDLKETYTGEAWASDLFALPTQNATNIITVNSSIPTSKLNVDYAEWGGKNE